MCAAYIRRVVEDVLSEPHRRVRSSSNSNSRRGRRGAGSERTRRLWWTEEKRRRAAQAAAQVEVQVTSHLLASFFSSWRSSVAQAAAVALRRCSLFRQEGFLHFWRVWRTAERLPHVFSTLDQLAPIFVFSPSPDPAISVPSSPPVTRSQARQAQVAVESASSPSPFPAPSDLELSLPPDPAVAQARSQVLGQLARVLARPPALIVTESRARRREQERIRDMELRDMELVYDSDGIVMGTWGDVFPDGYDGYSESYSDEDDDERLCPGFNHWQHAHHLQAAEDFQAACRADPDVCDFCGIGSCSGECQNW